MKSTVDEEIESVQPRWILQQIVDHVWRKWLSYLSLEAGREGTRDDPSGVATDDVPLDQLRG